MQELANPTCKVCKEEVEYPNWNCKKQPGHHLVAEKTYYHMGGAHIQSLRDRRMFTPTLILVPSYTRSVPGTGEAIQTEGLSVQFNDGRYSTSDPAEQYYLDRKQGLYSGEEGLKKWNAVYLTPAAQKDLAVRELETLQRQIKDSNDLLAATKAQKQGARA